MIKLIAILSIFLSTNAFAFGSEGCDTFTKFLWHADGTTTTASGENCGNVNNHVMAANGNATQVNGRGFNKWGAFDGTGDYFSIADGATNADWDPLTGDFAVDFLVNWVTVGNTRVIDIGNGIAAGGILIRYSSTNSRWEVYVSTVEPFGTNLGHVPVAGTVYHIALTRKGAEIRFFIDGVLIDTQTNSTSIDTASEVRIGIGTSGTEGLNGNIDEFRYTKGAFRWDRSFTKPTTPYCSGCEVSQWFV